MNTPSVSPAVALTRRTAHGTNASTGTSARGGLRHAVQWLAKLLLRGQTAGVGPIEPLDPTTLNPHLQRDLNLQGWTSGWVQTRRELHRYEQHKAGLPVRPFL